MCPDPIHLTLRGENVECAEFLFTTLQTFLLFGTQMFLKGSTLISHASSIPIHPVLNDLRTLVCKNVSCCFEFWMSAAFMCTIIVQPHRMVPHDACSFRCWRCSWGSLGSIIATTTPEKMINPVWPSTGCFC